VAKIFEALGAVHAALIAHHTAATVPANALSAHERERFDVTRVMAPLVRTVVAIATQHNTVPTCAFRDVFTVTLVAEAIVTASVAVQSRSSITKITLGHGY
jgi:hypothetical protein